jgi:hypothetical protein
MATTDEWTAFFSGKYQGRIRVPDGQWEDLIGSIDLDCRAHDAGSLDVTLTFLEFGRWSGRLRLEDRMMEGSTGQQDVRFRCEFLQSGPSGAAQGRFFGDIYIPPSELLYEFNLASEWRPDAAARDLPATARTAAPGG